MRIKEYLLFYFTILLFGINLLSFGMMENQAPIIGSPYTHIVEIPYLKDEQILAPNDTAPKKIFSLSLHKDNLQLEKNIHSPARIRKTKISKSAPIIPDTKTLLKDAMEKSPHYTLRRLSQ